MTDGGAGLVEDLLGSHVGRAFLELATDAGLVAGAAQDLGLALCLASDAASESSPWLRTGVRARLAARVDELRASAEALVASAGGEPTGWSRAFDPAVQRWAGTGAVVDLAARPRTQHTQPVVTGERWEAYAQLPVGWVVTDDEVVDAAGRRRSGSDEWAAHGLWDGPFTPDPDEVRRWRVTAPVAITEIDAPGDWAALVARFPGPVDEHAGRSLDWRELATDLDGVHLTLRGLLTAVRPVTTSGDDPVLWAWTSTGTRWARPLSTDELDPDLRLDPAAHTHARLTGDTLGDPRFEEGDEVDGSELGGAGR